MKRFSASATATITMLFAATLVWAGGMGGGMMGGGGHMMDSYGNGQMGSSRYHDQDSVQRRQVAQQRAQEDFYHDMRQLDRQIRQKEQALDAEAQKKSPDKTKVDKLRSDLSELEHRYDDRRAEFESRWGQDDQR